MDYSVKEDIIEYIFEKAKLFVLPSEFNGYTCRFLQSNFLFYFVGILLILKLMTAFISLNIPQNIFFADITKSALESFVNQTRQSAGLPALAENQKLNQAAQMKAQNMVQNQYFAHTSPNGISPWYWFSQAGYNYRYAGENLALGFFESEEVYNAWINSPSHRANIINPNYTEVGTAVVRGLGSDNSIVVVQEFASPISVVVKPPVVVKPVKPIVQQEKPIQEKPISTNNAPAIPANEKILPQTTASPGSLQSSPQDKVVSLSSKVLKTVANGYDGILQNVIYGTSSVVIGILMALIFFNFKVNFKKELVFRAVIVIVLLSLTSVLNKELIIALVPHQTVIQ